MNYSKQYIMEISDNSVALRAEHHPMARWRVLNIRK